MKPTTVQPGHVYRRPSGKNTYTILSTNQEQGTARTVCTRADGRRYFETSRLTVLETACVVCGVVDAWYLQNLRDNVPGQSVPVLEAVAS